MRRVSKNTQSVVVEAIPELVSHGMTELLLLYKIYERAGTCRCLSQEHGGTGRDITDSKFLASSETTEAGRGSGENFKKIQWCR
jgi:hypothetical protein